ncbi:MAG: heat-inducible transcriptional repressor HrcA [Chloroflexia bacterium]
MSKSANPSIANKSATQTMDQTGEIRISDRQRAILSIIIEEYVTSARPVASEQIVNGYKLAVSSATVRNDMAELERVGLIVQPHTSAGRIPTDRGYRYFVTNLMHPASLSQDEQRTIRHQFHQVELDAEEWVRLAASVLARTVHTAAVATAPRSIDVKLKHFELLAISESRLLLVLVGDEGSVTQQMLTVTEVPDQNELSALATRLNNALPGKSGAEIAEWAAMDENSTPLGPLAPTVLKTLSTMLTKLERPESSNIYHEGLSHILEQPEFRQPDRMQRVLEMFEQGDVWSTLITSMAGRDGVQVIIGDETTPEGMASCSVVLARYGLEDRMTGILGIVGPMRMPYSRSVSTVSYMSQLLSDLLGRAYNPFGKES